MNQVIAGAANSISKSELQQVKIDGESFLKVPNSDKLRPFFMSLVSDSNHWMFISSNGGLTAGRRNAQYALFPYYTDDKITESTEVTGSKTICKVVKNGKKFTWEPFSFRFSEHFEVTRNLYKNPYGDKLIFEEINHTLGLTFKYQWASSDKFGFVRKAEFINHASESVKISFIDGLQNILPASVVSDLQQASSNLVDAYKRSELETNTGMGIYALSAIPVDKAEPSEALKANVAWSIGISSPSYLVSSLQVENFRNGKAIQIETDVKAEKGAYFVHTEVSIEPNAKKQWYVVADVNYNQSAVVALQQKLLSYNDLATEIEEDIALGTKKLIQLVASADGLQRSEDRLRDIRHFSNSMFNIMRGGIFDNNYNIEKADFQSYMKHANKALASTYTELFASLTATFTYEELKEKATATKDRDLIRLATEYLPLKFSRRHGDPSRPWNKFSINTKDDNGKKILDYEGNWRDIFQNWESLSHSYPAFIEGMIFKFLNATTFDGYNPYRVTKGGFDWETIEPDDPWSYIGYWGDHQIIYLLKFLEFYEDYKPGQLVSLFSKSVFVYANVPYQIKPYDNIVNDPKDTIDFDHQLDIQIRNKREKVGADGALLSDVNGATVHANFIEKILATSLAKMSNFIPEAGIWLNTQRPEWNDANNALVGNGVSMVTLYYLRRFFAFFNQLFTEVKSSENYEVAEEVALLFNSIKGTLNTYQNLINSGFDNKQRKQVLDALGTASSEFRGYLYQHGFSGKKTSIQASEIKEFIKISLLYLEQSIQANQREDKLYHAYNLMTIKNDEVSIDYLDEMLEGQVAVLSSKYLLPNQALEVLEAMKKSALFRADQYSYILYPNKELKGFLDRNKIPEELVNSSKLLQELVVDKKVEIIEKDVAGNYHFNSHFNNAKKLKEALQKVEGKYQVLAQEELQKVLDVYEEVFNHKAFTGRSGTFYGYEGLGSIYWHMVSKLQLAVFEVCYQAIEQNTSPEIVGRLLEHYYEINEGIGVHKSPELYGAFPTDPYSHTPHGKGAQQPGMTGQVKEDVLSRFGELGVGIRQGKLQFSPDLLRKSEFVKEGKQVSYFSVSGEEKILQLQRDSLFFTFCQVPVVYSLAEKFSIEVVFTSTEIIKIAGNQLPEELSNSIFNREAKVEKIQVFVATNVLK